MLYFKTPGGQVFAYTDLAERQQFGAPDLVAITEQEVAVLTAPPVAGVPQSVTRFQALAALHLAGHLPAVEAIMAAPEIDMVAKLAWANALSFERSSPLLNGLAGTLGLTSQDLDDLFTAAAGIAA